MKMALAAMKLGLMLVVFKEVAIDLIECPPIILGGDNPLVLVTTALQAGDALFMQLDGFTVVPNLAFQPSQLRQCRLAIAQPTLTFLIPRGVF